MSVCRLLLTKTSKTPWRVWVLSAPASSCLVRDICNKTNQWSSESRDELAQPMPSRDIGRRSQGVDFGFVLIWVPPVNFDWSKMLGYKVCLQVVLYKNPKSSLSAEKNIFLGRKIKSIFFTFTFYLSAKKVYMREVVRDLWKFTGGMSVCRLLFTKTSKTPWRVLVPSAPDAMSARISLWASSPVNSRTHSITFFEGCHTL